ncbi:MAG: hypothetical protein R3E32_11065 [Chitinophagales bacterium]
MALFGHLIFLTLLTCELSTSTDRSRSRCIDHFTEIRAKKLRKRPATAELLTWIHIFDKLEVNLEVPTPEQLQKLASTYSILAKNPEDLKRLRENL